jgi:tetratricopeptide (TPR) repeat protein
MSSQAANFGRRGLYREIKFLIHCLALGLTTWVFPILSAAQASLEAPRVDEESRRAALIDGLRKRVETEASPENRAALSTELQTLGAFYFFTLRRNQDAVRELEEAVAIRRDLVANDSLEYLPLAEGLVLLGNAYNASDQAGNANRVFTEAIEILRSKVPIEFAEDAKPELATALNSQGNLYRYVRQFEPAEKLFKEALALWRELAGTDPDYGANIVMALQNLARMYGESGRPDASRETFEEALPVAREAAKAVVSESPRLARTLAELARLYGQGHSRATTLLEEALPIYRDLVRVNTDYEVELQDTLHLLAGLYRAERQENGARLLDEALAIGRKLWSRNPEMHGDALARVLISKATYAPEHELSIQCPLAEEAMRVASDEELQAIARRILSRCSTIY